MRKLLSTKYSAGAFSAAMLLLRLAVGMVEGMGYTARYKHNGAMMTYGANHLVRI